MNIYMYKQNVWFEYETEGEKGLTTTDVQISKQRMKVELHKQRCSFIFRAVWGHWGRILCICRLKMFKFKLL